MVIEQLSLENVQITSSPYYFAATTDSDSTALLASIKASGIIAPLIAYPSETGIQLIDGFKRCQCARQLGIQSVPVMLLAHDSELMSRLMIALQQRQAVLQSNAAARAQFLRLAHNLGLARPALEELLKLLGLPAHDKLIRQYLAISQLPEPVLDYCLEKNFSLKQCFHLSKHPRELLVQLFEWKSRLHLTASVIEEILNNFKDILRVEERSLPQLLEEDELQQLIQATASPQERTQRLRQWAKQRRFPMLSEIQARMQQYRHDMVLPDQLHIDWDDSLERQELRLSLKLKQAELWPELIKQLQHPSLTTGINQLLGEL